MTKKTNTPQKHPEEQNDELVTADKEPFEPSEPSEPQERRVVKYDMNSIMEGLDFQSFVLLPGTVNAWPGMQMLTSISSDSEEDLQYVEVVEDSKSGKKPNLPRASSSSYPAAHRHHEYSESKYSTPEKFGRRFSSPGIYPSGPVYPHSAPAYVYTPQVPKKPKRSGQKKKKS